MTLRDERDGKRDATVTLDVTAEVPPERLERRAHRCGVIDEHGKPCTTWTLRHACLKHRRQGAGHTLAPSNTETGASHLFSRIQSEKHELNHDET